MLQFLLEGNFRRLFCAISRDVELFPRLAIGNPSRNDKKRGHDVLNNEETKPSTKKLISTFYKVTFVDVRKGTLPT